MKKYDKAVFVGRMQPLHKGHLVNIQKCFEIAEEVIIVIGSGFAPTTIKNPFSDEDRYYMINDAIRSLYGNDVIGKYRIEFVRDHLYSDEDWITEVQQLVQQHQGEKVAFVGHDKDGTASHLEMFPQWDFIDTEKVIRHNGELYHASDFREEMFTQGKFPESWKDCLNEQTVNYIKLWTQSKQFENLVEEYNYIKEYPEKWGKGPFITTDAVVVSNGHVLMITRGANPGKHNLALPGGFLEPDETIEDGCFRELKEETKIKVPPGILKKGLVEMKIFDHPKRSLRGRIITFAYFIKLDAKEGLPRVKGADDASYAEWIPLSRLDSMTDRIHEDHYSIIKYFI